MSTRKRSQPDTPTRTPANADTAAVARHQPGRLQTGTQLGVVSPEVTQLRFLGFTTCQVPQKTMEALEYACNTYQLQLNKCSKQHPQNKFPWYTESQRKQQLEMRIGSEVHNNQEVLRDCTRVVIQKFDVLAKKLMNQIASTLSLPETAFLPLLEGPHPEGQLAASALEAIHYHSPEEILHLDDAEDASADCGAHAHEALLTLIYADTEQGLQVIGPHGSWIPLIIPGGHIAVLAGHTLERATCGLVKAAVHRVVVGNDGCVTARNVVAYKLRASGSGVMDLFPDQIRSQISRIHKGVSPRLQAPVEVREQMSQHSTKRRSVNDLHKEHGKPAIQEATKQPNATPGQDSETFEVFVTSLTGCNTPLKMHSDMSTNSLYTAVAAKEGIPEDDFRLMFAENLLERGKFCRHYGMQSESMVDFLVKLRDS